MCGRIFISPLPMQATKEMTDYELTCRLMQAVNDLQKQVDELKAKTDEMKAMSAGIEAKSESQLMNLKLHFENGKIVKDER